MSEDFKPNVFAETEDDTEISCKRAYMIPEKLKELKFKCIKDGCDGKVHLFHDYLSYPWVGFIEEGSASCDECYNEIPFYYKFRVLFEVEVPEELISQEYDPPDPAKED